MAFKGDGTVKKLVQTSLAKTGYKIVRLKDYEIRTNGTARPQVTFNKLFCIGFNKTATTTLEAVLRDLGYRLPKQLEQESILRPVLTGGGTETLRAFVDDYDAFQDLPFSQNTTYITADVLCPNSKFILTLRDPDRWVESYIRFYRREFGLDGVTEFTEDTFADKLMYLEPGYVHDLMRPIITKVADGAVTYRWDLVFDRDHLIDVYTRRNDDIIRYFAHRPDDLLVLDPTQEPDTGRLLRFLGHDDVTPGPFPTLNAR